MSRLKFYLSVSKFKVSAITAFSLLASCFFSVVYGASSDSQSKKNNQANDLTRQQSYRQTLSTAIEPNTEEAFPWSEFLFPWSRENITPNGYRQANGSAKVKNIAYYDVLSQYNPNGLQVIAGATRRGVFKSGKRRIIDHHYFQIGVESKTSPAAQGLALKLVYQPHPVLNLSVEYGANYYFGLIGGFYNFDTPFEPYGDGDKPTESSQFETYYQLNPTLTIALGSLLIRNKSTYWVSEFNSEKEYAHNAQFDLLIKSNEPVLVNQTDLGLLAFGRRGGISSLGIFQEVATAQDSKLYHRRVGLQLFEQLPGRVFGLKNPRIYAQIGRHLEDRNRDDTLYVGFGFGVEWRMR